MDCLSNLVGIKGGCGTPSTPSSGLYINQLPGISIQEMNDVVNAEQKSGQDFLLELSELADTHIVNDIQNHLAEYMRLTTVLEGDVIGRYEDDLPLLNSESGQYKGIQIKIDEYPYLSLFVSSIRLQLATVQTTNILVFDLMTGKQLDSLAITTVADEITEVIVNKEYKATRQKLNLLFVYDAGVSNARRTSLYTGGASVGCRSCSGGYYPGGGGYAQVRGISIPQTSTKTNVNVVALSTTAGMSLTYSLNCNPEPFICQIANRLGMAKMYKWGELAMFNRIHSNRLNHTVLVDREKAQELRAEYMGEYISRMSSILGNMKYPQDICFTCRPPIQKVVQIP